MPIPPPLLPRGTPADAGVSSAAVLALLDRLERGPVEPHSLVVVRHGRVVVEAGWAPYRADHPQLLYSLTKSFTSAAVGLAVADGLLSPDDRVVDVLPDHVPPDAPAQAHRLTVEHLLTMTTGHVPDGLGRAWALEPQDLTRGFLRLPFAHAEGTRHHYEDATTYVLARMVERVTGRDLPGLLDERLLGPMGVTGAEWDRVASGAVFGFHGLHLTTHAVAAFGELLLRDGRWGDGQLLPRDWVRRATSPLVASTSYRDDDAADAPDFAQGYGYQVWTTRHGYLGNGAFGQLCVVVPSHDLVVAMTAEGEAQAQLDALWECLLPGLDAGPRSAGPGDEDLTLRLRGLALPCVPGGSPDAHVTDAVLDPTAPDSALPDGGAVRITPADGGWRVRLADVDLEVGHGVWRRAEPLGRPVVASGAWRDGRWCAELRPLDLPHRVRLDVDPAAGTATATWSTVPLTTPDLRLHLRTPLMTRPDVA